MANWNEIPRDIWRLILQKVITVIIDHVPFCGVCRLWRSIGLEYRRSKFPANVSGLTIPGGPTTATRTRRFLAFPVGKDISQLDHDWPVLSVPHESLCRGSHRGWLVIMEKNMTMYIYNPISGVRVRLPPVTALPLLRLGKTRMSKWYVDKAILSVTPASCSVDCLVLVFYGCYEMAYCKVGDTVWTSLEGPKRVGYPDFRYIDAIFHKEAFYIMDHYGGICILDVNLPHPKVTELGISPPLLIPCVQKWYLVEFGGELLQIWRAIVPVGYAEADINEGQHNANEDYDNDQGEEEEDINEGEQNYANEDSDQEGEEEEEEEVNGGGGGGEVEAQGGGGVEFDEFDYENNYVSSSRYSMNRTIHFKVFKLDVISGLEPKWIDVKDLDGGGVFVGLNQSFALSKSNLAGYKGDRIYYTDDIIGSHKLHIRSGNDIGAFNLLDSIYEPLFSTHSESTKPPAVWITPMQY
ncbi:hypothetical protein RHSIM_Rhsim09G0016200 [Rhododendron simsii]|uniref:KIB1-4 beta-propeller domain-containing protein n=1 Tax=Rhododendron simsii TaxID=118357 RepID=A0A834GIW1_RHOSS|nr:hypothetical protein RHSIM_Rhsim09G0016200 [Rhododendron simsii]